METVDWLYTAEQMWGHQSQSALLKQLKQWDAFILHDSASPNLNKQSTDYSLWPLIYYSESIQSLENNNKLRLGETGHKTMIKRPPASGGRICWNKRLISKECVKALRYSNDFMLCADVLVHTLCPFCESVWKKNTFFFFFKYKLNK